jgi:hypothetical protein
MCQYSHTPLTQTFKPIRILVAYILHVCFAFSRYMSFNFEKARCFSYLVLRYACSYHQETVHSHSVYRLFTVILPLNLQ